MRLLKGRRIADKVLAGIRKRIIRSKIRPVLAVILVGKNKSSKVYVNLKQKAAEIINLGFLLYKFESKVEQEDIIKLIKNLNKNKSVSGIIVQLPLPRKYNTNQIINSISPHKDADGFHSKNIKKFLSNKKVIEPVFPRAIVKLLESSNLKLKNKKAIILANSEIFGTVMAQALKKKKINPQIILKSNFSEKIGLLKKADIIITAVGRPKLITGAMIKKHAIVIDGGISKRKGKIYGDVDFDSLIGIASYLSPVPGGVGPVTVACLLENVCKLVARKNK